MPVSHVNAKCSGVSSQHKVLSRAQKKKKKKKKKKKYN